MAPPAVRRRHTPNRTRRVLTPEPKGMNHLHTLQQALMEDTSKYALCREDSAQLGRMIRVAQGYIEKGSAPRTLKRDRPKFVKWAKICRRKGTTPWRDDAKANSGEDPAGHKREIILAISYIVECKQNDKTRPNGSNRTRVKPQSAANNYRVVRWEFKRNLMMMY